MTSLDLPQSLRGDEYDWVETSDDVEYQLDEAADLPSSARHRSLRTYKGTNYFARIEDDRQARQTWYSLERMARTLRRTALGYESPWLFDPPKELKK